MEAERIIPTRFDAESVQRPQETLRGLGSPISRLVQILEQSIDISVFTASPP
jgi:hypothetical protein